MTRGVVPGCWASKGLRWTKSKWWWPFSLPARFPLLCGPFRELLPGQRFIPSGWEEGASPGRSVTIDGQELERWKEHCYHALSYQGRMHLCSSFISSILCLPPASAHTHGGLRHLREREPATSVERHWSPPTIAVIAITGPAQIRNAGSFSVGRSASTVSSPLVRSWGSLLLQDRMRAGSMGTGFISTGCQLRIRNCADDGYDHDNVRHKVSRRQLSAVVCTQPERLWPK